MTSRSSLHFSCTHISLCLHQDQGRKRTNKGVKHWFLVAVSCTNFPNSLISTRSKFTVADCFAPLPICGSCECHGLTCPHACQALDSHHSSLLADAPVAQPRSRNTPNPSWEGTQAPCPAHASPAAPQGPQPRATGLQEAARRRSGFAPPAPVPQSIPKPVLHPGSPRSAQEPLGRALYVQAPVAAQQCRQQCVTQHRDESHSTRATHRTAFPLLACKAAARDAHVSNK